MWEGNEYRWMSDKVCDVYKICCHVGGVNDYYTTIFSPVITHIHSGTTYPRRIARLNRMHWDPLHPLEHQTPLIILMWSNMPWPSFAGTHWADVNTSGRLPVSEDRAKSSWQLKPRTDTMSKIWDDRSVHQKKFPAHDWINLRKSGEYRILDVANVTRDA